MKKKFKILVAECDVPDDAESIEKIISLSKDIYEIVQSRNKGVKMDKESFVIGFANAMLLSNELKKEENNSTKKGKEK